MIDCKPKIISKMVCSAGDFRVETSNGITVLVLFNGYEVLLGVEQSKHYWAMQVRGYNMIRTGLKARHIRTVYPNWSR